MNVCCRKSTNILSGGVCGFADCRRLAFAWPPRGTAAVPPSSAAAPLTSAAGGVYLLPLAAVRPLLL